MLIPCFCQVHGSVGPVRLASHLAIHGVAFCGQLADRFLLYNSCVCSKWNQSWVANSILSNAPALLPFVIAVSFLFMLLSSATLVISVKLRSQSSSPDA